MTAVGGSAKVCGSFRVPRAAKPDGPREAGGKKIKKYFRLRVDRAAAVLLKSQPAPRTVETPDGARNLISDIRSSSAEPKDHDPEGMRKDRNLC